MVDCAALLLEKGHPEAALDVCSLSPPSHPHPSLLTVQLEAMGRLGRETEMETLVRNVSLTRFYFLQNLFQLMCD